MRRKIEIAGCARRAGDLFLDYSIIGGSGFGRRPYALHGKHRTTALIENQRLAPFTKMEITNQKALIKLFNKVVNLQTFLITFSSLMPDPGIFPIIAGIHHKADKFAPQAFSRRVRPRQTIVRYQKVSTIQGKRIFSKPYNLVCGRIQGMSGAKCVNATGEAFKCPDIHPAMALIYTQTAILKLNHLIHAEQAPQAMERSFEGLVRYVPFHIGPDHIGDPDRKSVV